jgi:hypothetical protein
MKTIIEKFSSYGEALDRMCELEARGYEASVTLNRTSGLYEVIAS